jgi:serine/threonine protein phosphatase PrpC
MKFKIKAYNLQELGQRTNQEDSLFPALGKSTSDDRLFVLCDGMGGHEKGEVASATVCETLSRVILSAWHPGEVLSDELFLQALSAAYDALDAKDNGEERKMGTTLTFLCLHASGATVAHIGDSRIYQLRPASKNTSARIVFRTQDHSLVNDLVKIGEITEEEAKHHPQKNVITRAMQPCQEHRAKADIAHLTDILPGDYFYMCSDGMLEEASDENILNIITKPNATDEQKLEMLRNVTEENKDNHTAHLIHIDGVEGVSATITSTSSGVSGTWITPEFNKPKKTRKVWPWIVGIAIIAVIAAAASFFMCGGKNCASELVGDSIKLAPAKVRPIEHKKDTLKKDTATSNVIRDVL